MAFGFGLISVLVLLAILAFGAVFYAISARRSVRKHRPGRVFVLLLMFCLVGSLVFFVAREGHIRYRHPRMSRPHHKVGTPLRTRLDHQLQPPADVDWYRSHSPKDKYSPPFATTDKKASPPVEQSEPASDGSADPDASPETPTAPETPVVSWQEIELDGSDPEAEADPGLDPTMRNKVQIDYEARPEWVDQPDQDIGQVHQIAVASGPFLRLRNARKQLHETLKSTTDEYINEVVGHPRAAAWIGYEQDEIRDRFVTSDHVFDEKVVSPSFGPMHQSHALLEFGPQFHEEVARAWHQVVARTRLIKVALVSAAVLGMLVLLFGYFKADTATRGSYSTRLKFATFVAILALLATGVMIARSIPWLWL